MKEIKEIIQSSNPKNPNSDKMKGWEIAEFEKCLEKVIYTNKIQRKDFKEEGIYPIVSQEKDFINGYWDNEDDIFRVDKPVVIFGDHTQVIKFVDFDFVLGADGVKILKPNDKIDPKYFYYFLQNIELGSLGYARHYRLLKEINVAFPKSLPEQQRIVSILDECFSAIERSRNNAEQNLKNTKEVFESYLQGIMSEPRLTRLKDSQDFKNQGNQANQKNQGSDKGDGWEVKKLGEIVDIINGRNQSQVISENGKFPIYGSAANLMGYATDYLCEKGTTIIGRKGNISNPIYVEERFWNVDTAFGLFPKNGYDTKFIYYLCRTIDFKSRNRGTTIPSLVKSDLLSIDVPFISSIKEQQTIVHQLDALRAETQKLEAVYQKKLDDLEELKKSVLKRAFAGEL